MGGNIANDDYFVIVCKVLTYYYGCLKRKIVFDNYEFENFIKTGISEVYFEEVLNMMSDE